MPTNPSRTGQLPTMTTTGINFWTRVTEVVLSLFVSIIDCAKEIADDAIYFCFEDFTSSPSNWNFTLFHLSTNKNFSSYVRNLVSVFMIHEKYTLQLYNTSVLFRSAVFKKEYTVYQSLSNNSIRICSVP